MNVISDAVIWHDLECGAYAVDLPLWRALAAEHGDPVIDIGAGTGRVALDLARHGFAVAAVEHDAELAAALAVRADRLPVRVVCADARTLTGVGPAPLMIVPMQSVQLFGGPAGRAAFLTAARAALRPGGVLALAIADTIDAAAAGDLEPPLPDMRELDGVLYSSQPIAVFDDAGATAIERLRQVIDDTGTRSSVNDVIRLDKLTAGELEAEGAAAGFTVLARRDVPWTDEYVGSTVVMLGA